MDQLKIVAILALTLTQLGCSKLIEIRPPSDTITTGQVFQSKADADAAIMGIYGKLAYSSTIVFGNGAFSLFFGAYGDELVASRTEEMPFYESSVDPTNGTVFSAFWANPYEVIYQVNASIEGVNLSTNFTNQEKLVYNSELKFLRAFCYFHLVVAFGDVPYLTSSEWKISSKEGRTSQTVILNNLLTDLEESAKYLPSDYLASKNERTRATSWACYALSSRIALLQRDWIKAKEFSGRILSKVETFTLEPEYDNVFSTKSREAILQWDNSSTNMRPYNGTMEQSFLDFGSLIAPTFSLTESLLTAFDASDKRRLKWMKSIEYEGIEYLIPSKYKIGFTNTTVDGQVTEYYTVFRLAEQILIHAETAARTGDLSTAIMLINRIRDRAGLSPVDDNITQDELLNVLFAERQKELFCEWGLRYQDILRFGFVDQILGKKAKWRKTSIVLPIPSFELKNNPALKQNPGY